jgi:hypothetical protein
MGEKTASVWQELWIFTEYGAVGWTHSSHQVTSPEKKNVSGEAGWTTPAQTMSWCGLDTPPRPSKVQKWKHERRENKENWKSSVDSKIAFTQEQVLKECKRTLQLEEAKPEKRKNKRKTRKNHAHAQKNTCMTGVL